MAPTTTRESPADHAFNSLSSASGLTLHAYKRDHVAGRIQRSLERERLGHTDDLIALVRRDASARARFRRMLAISVTGRFRDPRQFDLLSEKILPDLLGRVDTLRVWSAGCSTGQELTSVGMLVDHLGALDRARLLGSDVLAENIEIARAGSLDGVPGTPAIAARCRWEVRDLI